MPARSQPEADCLVVAVSARALVQAARRAGRRPAALDLFADVDTVEAAVAAERVPAGDGIGFDPEALLERAGRWPGLDLIAGAGFEAKAELLDRLGRGRRVIGNSAETVARVKDPAAFARLLDRLGVPHPEFGWRPGRAHVAKRPGGAGGSHVRPADREPAPPGHYIEERVEGEPVSALFLADGIRVVLIAFSRQWLAPTAEKPFRFGGAAGPIAPVPQIAAILEKATRAVGLRGLNGADFLVRPDGLDLIEINPRPPATIDLYDRPPMPSLLALHEQAVAGRLPEAPLPTPSPAAFTILYADGEARVPQAMHWPAWTADRPQPGSTIAPGWPICTVSA